MTDSVRATFFISTGRCGTQWVHRTLEDAFPDEAVVTHEPIQAAYRPRRFLRAGARLTALLDDPAVANHVAMIQRVLQLGKIYVEVGWPCYAALPLLARELGGRVNFVHLVRDPVPTALSLATHAVYDRDDWIAEGAISPFDEGVIQKDLAPLWSEMTMYEKCLFWWTEINRYGLELQREHPEIRYLRVRYEDLFAPGEPDALRRLVSHCGLPFVDQLARSRTQRVDRFQQEGAATDWNLIFRYPRTVSLARELGYRLDGGATAEIADQLSRHEADSPTGRELDRSQKLRLGLRSILGSFRVR